MNEIVNSVENNTNPLATITSDSCVSYTSINANSFEEKARIYNATSNPDKHIKECIGDVIEIKDVCLDSVEIVDEKTGEIFNGVRTVIITPDNTTYVATSCGVVTSLKGIFKMFGTPDMWEKPIKVKIKQSTTRSGNSVLTFEIVC